jgi:hypothetical protein
MLTEQEREQINLIVAGVSGKLETKIEGMVNLFTEKNNNVCKDIVEIKSGFTQHDKRISKLETSFAYQIGRIAAISAMIGGLVSVVVAIIGIN